MSSRSAKLDLVLQSEADLVLKSESEACNFI